jgi:filamin
MGENVTWGEPVNSGWIDIQKRTFTKWCNSHVAERMLKINNLDTDFEDGVLLCALLEQISSKNVGIVNKKPKIRAQKLENTGAALRFLRDEGIKLVAIGPEDITDGRTKLILGLIWTIILRYQIQKVAVGVGNSAKQDLLAWVRKQIPEYNITNFKENWQDGRALCALTNSLEPGILDLSALPHRTPLENARAGTEAAEKDLGIPPILQPEDLVSPDVDELSVMTYISYFRDYEQEKLKLLESESLARIPDPLKCIAFGPGLEKAEVGYDADFTVQLRTATGKNVTVGGETTVDVQIKTPLNSPPIKAEVTDNGDGTYHVKYVPKAQGKTVINVNVRSKPIQNSPFSVNVDKLGVDASKSQAYGPGLQGGATKEPTHFTIVANNKKGDPVGSGGDRFDVKITDPYGTEIKSEVVDNKDGTYNVNYKPADVGNHTISVQHEGKNVADSPYHVKIDTSSSGPDPSQSQAYGPGLNGAVGGEPAHFTIQARNKAGEKLTRGGDAFDVEVLGPDESPVDVKIVDNRDGTYGVTYHPEDPGKYKVDVILRGNNPLYYDHVGNSPVVVDAAVGIDPSKSLVFGPGVEDGVLNTKPAEFFIQPKDKDGKNVDRHHDADTFEIKVTDQNGNQIDSPITDNGDGTYKVVYEPTGVGRHKVDVRLKGKPVGNTPVSVNVKDGAWYENTHVDSFSFVIRTKTKQNKDKKEGGETFEVKIVHEGNKEEVKNIKITDIGDGTYVVSYNLPSDGDYKVNVLLNGRHIKGSPWKQSH